MRQKMFIGVAVFVFISMAGITLGSYLLVARNALYTIVQPIAPYPAVCPQDVKQCPDGSYVGRNGTNCEFTRCPAIQPEPETDICEYVAPPPGCTYVEGENYNKKTMCGLVLNCQDEKTVVLREGERSGPLLVQKIYPTYITGLNFREYPVAANYGQPVTLYVGESAGNGCTVTLTLTKIEEGTATFTEKIDNNRPCPICLAENTLIDTLVGQIPVQELREGMAVWTTDTSGSKIAATVIKTSKAPVSAIHQMVRVVLADGREIFASPRHPIGDGRIFNDLSTGDSLDGSSIVITQKVTYDKYYTYDILPEGPTGLYFANGILISSTLW